MIYPSRLIKNGRNSGSIKQISEVLKKPTKHWSLLILVHILKITIFNHIERKLVLRKGSTWPH